MKNKILIVLTVIIISTLDCICQKGAIVEGFISDANGEFIILTHLDRYRGNINFDGFKNIGAVVNDKGIFKLKSDKIAHGATYGLEVLDKGTSFTLMEGDSIRIDFSLEDMNKAVLTGKGAGKNNIKKLDEFQYDYFDLDSERSFTKFVDYLDSINNIKRNLLNAIYTKDNKSNVILQSPNKLEIQRIIAKTPLSVEEYKFLNNLIKAQSNNMFIDYMSAPPAIVKSDNSIIDLNGKNFRHFQKEEYEEFTMFCDWNLESSLETILQIEFLREKQKEENKKITLENWKSLIDPIEYDLWVSIYLKNIFGMDLFRKYYATKFAFQMTLGIDHKKMYEFIDLNKSNKYSSRLIEYENYLDYDNAASDVGLYQDKLQLDQIKFDELLASYKNSGLLIVFWSAQFAGSTIINKLPSLKYINKKYKNDINIVYICIDKQENKGLWAARIQDEEWNASHYFLPIEGNDTVLNRFSTKHISSMCNGGTSFSFINKRGEIDNKIKPPYQLRFHEIKEYYK